MTDSVKRICLIVLACLILFASGCTSPALNQDSGSSSETAGTAAEDIAKQSDEAAQDVDETITPSPTPVISELVDVYTPDEYAKSVEILKTMDKQTVVNYLSGLLNNEDTFYRGAEFIEKLGYPEFEDAIISSPIKDSLFIYSRYAFDMLRAYAKFPKVAAKIKSLMTDPEFRLYLAKDYFAGDYKDGLKYKTKGKGDGKQDRIIILENAYGEFNDDKAAYKLIVSELSFELIPEDKQLSLMVSEPADTAIYIKTKLVRRGTYNFKSLHKKVKGYRRDYVITMVDLKQNKFWAQRRLKGISFREKFTIMTGTYIGR